MSNTKTPDCHGLTERKQCLWLNGSTHNHHTQCGHTDKGNDVHDKRDKNPDLITQTNIWKLAELVKVVFSQQKEGQLVLDRTKELPTQLVCALSGEESFIYSFFSMKHVT